MQRGAGVVDGLENGTENMIALPRTRAGGTCLEEETVGCVQMGRHDLDETPRAQACCLRISISKKRESTSSPKQYNCDLRPISGPLVKVEFHSLEQELPTPHVVVRSPSDRPSNS